MNFICGAQNQRILLKIYNKKQNKKKPTGNCKYIYRIRAKIKKHEAKMPYKRPNG